MIGGLASIFGTTVIFEISEHITLYWVFTGMGIFVVLVALLMIFGVRDIILLKKKQLLLESITSTPVTQNASRRVKEKSCM